MKKLALCMSLVFAASYGAVSVQAAAPENLKTVLSDPSLTELYGFSVDAQEITLQIGEMQQLSAEWDGDCYLPDSLWFSSEDDGIAWVYHYGDIIACAAGTTTVCVSAKLNPEKVRLSPEDTGYRTIRVKVTVSDSALTAPQKAALERLEQIEPYDRYLRERAVLADVLSDHANRLTREEVNIIIDEYASFDAIMERIRSEQPYPDIYSGRDPLAVVYWLDDFRTEAITVIDTSQIIYSRIENEGGMCVVREVQYLYPEKQEPFQPETEPFDPDTPDSFYSYLESPEKQNVRSDLAEAFRLLDEYVSGQQSAGNTDFDEVSVRYADYFSGFTGIIGEAYRNKVILYYPDTCAGAVQPLLKAFMQEHDIDENRVYHAVRSSGKWSDMYRGDANCKDGVDVSDAVLVARFCAEDPAAEISAQGREFADMDNDGNLTANDVVEILKLIAKIR